jgi:phosphoenolpyruvate carboxylase
MRSATYRIPVNEVEKYWRAAQQEIVQMTTQSQSVRASLYSVKASMASVSEVVDNVLQEATGSAQHAVGHGECTPPRRAE